jgi:hypothetical protein
LKPPFPVYAAACFCAGVAASFFTLPIWVIPLIQAGREGGRSDWLGFAGAIIGSSFTSIVAGAAIYFASRSIRQQITAALLSREEDRIERDLPGLRDARNYLNRFVATFSPVTAFFEIGPELNRLGIGLPNSTLTQDVKRLLPGTHDATLIQVQRFLGNAQSAVLAAQNARHSFQHFENNVGDPAHWDPAALAAHRTEIANIRRAFDQHRADFRNELEAILAYIDGLGSKIELYEHRLIQIRRELNEFFDNV